MIPPSVAAAIQALADLLYVPCLLVLLFGTGLFLTLRYRGVHIRDFAAALRVFVASHDRGAAGALSPFQAFMTALAATKLSIQRRVCRSGTPKTFGGPLTPALTSEGNQT